MRTALALLSVVFLVGCGSGSSVTAPDEPALPKRYDQQPIQYGLRYVPAGYVKYDTSWRPGKAYDVTKEVLVPVPAIWADTASYTVKYPDGGITVDTKRMNPGWWVVLEANRRSKAAGLDTVYSWDRIDTGLAVRQEYTDLYGVTVRWDSIAGLKTRNTNGFRLPTLKEAQYLERGPIIGGKSIDSTYSVGERELNFFGVSKVPSHTNLEGGVFQILDIALPNIAIPWFVRNAN